MLALMRDNCFANNIGDRNMSTNKMIIADNAININADGLYCLNDLHKAAMAQGKATESQRPPKFLDSDSVKGFVQALSDARKRASVVTVKGGKNQGTYADELVVMRYAAWIDPAYEIEVYAAVQALKRGDIDSAVAITKSNLATEALAEQRRSNAVEKQIKNAAAIYELLPNLGVSSRQAIAANLVNPAAGRDIIPLPRIEEKFYTTTELAKDLEMTAAMLGRVANQHGMKKPDETGEYRLSQSNHSAKQVEQWYWNLNGAEQMRDLVKRLRG